MLCVHVSIVTKSVYGDLLPFKCLRNSHITSENHFCNLELHYTLNKQSVLNVCQSTHMHANYYSYYSNVQPIF